MPVMNRTLLLGGLLTIVPALPLSAQESCFQGRINEINVSNGSIVDEAEMPSGLLGFAYRMANRLHIRTREDFLRSELLFEVGDCYDPFLIEDSERLLRRYGFLSEVAVSAARDDGDGWRVQVSTQDEWSSRLETTVDFDNGINLRQIAVAETNVAGRGITLRGFLQQNDAERLLGGTVALPRLLGTRANLGLSLGTTRIGDFRAAQISYPFVGEVGRWAGQVAYSEVEDYFSYSRGDVRQPGYILLPVNDQRYAVTLATRFGEPGNLAILGVGISREELEFPGYPGSVEIVDRDEFGSTAEADLATADSLFGQTAVASGTRLNLLLGQRNIRFVQRTGLDALRGVQDVEVGTDISLTLGRTINQPGPGAADDLLVRLRFFGALAPAPWTLVTNFSIEGRQLFFDPSRDRSGWRDVLAELDALLYLQPPRYPSHTLLAKVSAAGGWAVDVPYQLTLGGRRSVRGFDDADFAGGRRLVLTLEDRIYFGWPFPETFDLGGTLFADAGRTWAGDVPFGVDSGWKGTVGAGLRFGFPSGSRGIVRLDLAHPIGSGAGARGLTLRISGTDLVGLINGIADPQVDRSRLSRTGPDRFTPAR